MAAGAIVYGCDVSQDVCPWNQRIAGSLPEDSPFAAREALAGKDARTLAREVLAMDADLYRAAFRGSPMKRAKLPGMQRNAAVVLGSVGTESDVDVLTRALDDPEPLVREHAAWGLRQFDGEREVPRLSDQGGAKPERRVDVRR